MLYPKRDQGVIFLLRLVGVLRLNKALSINEVKEIEEEWRAIFGEVLRHPKFIFLDKMVGGFLDFDSDGGVSTLDFSHWVVAQGEEVCQNFLLSYSSIERYIKKHNLKEEDYNFKGLMHVFGEVYVELSVVK